MVQLSKEQIGEFKKLIKQRFGVEYSDAEASGAAHKFVNLFRVVYGGGKSMAEREKE